MVDKPGKVSCFGIVTSSNCPKGIVDRVVRRVVLLFSLVLLHTVLLFLTMPSNWCLMCTHPKSH